jgi:hypothetical protein
MKAGDYICEIGGLRLKLIKIGDTHCEAVCLRKGQSRWVVGQIEPLLINLLDYVVKNNRNWWIESTPIPHLLKKYYENT